MPTAAWYLRPGAPRPPLTAFCDRCRVPIGDVGENWFGTDGSNVCRLPLGTAPGPMRMHEPMRWFDGQIARLATKDHGDLARCSWQAAHGGDHDFNNLGPHAPAEQRCGWYVRLPRFAGQNDPMLGIWFPMQ